MFLLAEQKSKHDTIYLFSETWRGYREAEDSDGSFLNTWFPYLMTITFQCFSCGSKVSYRKALVCLHKELSLSNVKYFAVLEWVFVWREREGELEVPVHVLYCSGLHLSSWIEWRRLAGVVQRNQPCLHGHPVCWIGFQDLVLFPFTTRESGGRPVCYGERKSAFSISSFPHPWAEPLSPSYQHASNFQRVACTVLCFVSRDWIKTSSCSDYWF